MLAVVETSAKAATAAAEEQKDDDYPPEPHAATKTKPSKVAIHASKSPFRCFLCIICGVGGSWLHSGNH